MAHVTRQRNGELLRNLFQILLQHPDGLPAREALAKLRTQVKPTTWEEGRFESGVSRFDQIVRFATVDAKKAGWMLKEKGQWAVTEEGREALKQFPDNDAFFGRAKQLYAQWRKGIKESGVAASEVSEVEVEKSPEIILEQVEEQAWAEIQQYLRDMPPYDFQELVASLLRAMGHHVPWVAPPGKDGGFDILAWTDPLGIRTPRIKVQVRRVGQNINVDQIRAFAGLLGDDEVGLFVTTSDFTKDAQEAARTHTKKQVTLVNFRRLIELLLEHHERLDEKGEHLFPLRKVYLLDLSE
jgi:restriction system protein